MGLYSRRASPACPPPLTATSTCLAVAAVGHALPMPWSVDGAQAGPEPTTDADIGQCANR